MPVEFVVSRRHFYLKVRRWAGEYSLTTTIMLWNKHHITFHLTIG